MKIIYYITDHGLGHSSRSVAIIREMIKKKINVIVRSNNEKFFKKSLWGNRIRFEMLSGVKNWNDGIDPPINTMLNIGRKVIEKGVFEELIKNAEKNGMFEKLITEK